MITYPLIQILSGVAASCLVATAVARYAGRLGFPLPSLDRRLGCIDGLRGYLALAVLFHHFIIWLQTTRLGGTWSAPPICFFNQLGAAGVALFFMITGFLFYPRILKGFRSCSWLNIYVGRIFRIIPLVLFSVIAVTSLIIFRTGRTIDLQFPFKAASWVMAMGEPPLLNYPDSGRLNAYVLWSLHYEWIFYIVLLPACAVLRELIRDKCPTWILPGLILVSALLGQTLLPAGSVLTYVPLFAVGMIAFECQRHGTIRRTLCTRMAAFLALAALGLGMTMLPDPYGWGLPLFSLFFISVACGNSLAGLLNTTGARVLGECSFGIYLLHGIVLSILFVDTSAWWTELTVGQMAMLIPVATIAVLLITLATFLFIEMPAIIWGRMLTRWLQTFMRPPSAE